MNNAIYLEAERLRKKYNTRDPFELLEAANVVVDFTREFPKNGLKYHSNIGGVCQAHADRNSIRLLHCN